MLRPHPCFLLDPIVKIVFKVLFTFILILYLLSILYVLPCVLISCSALDPHSQRGREERMLREQGDRISNFISATKLHVILALLLYLPESQFSLSSYKWVIGDDL